MRKVCFLVVACILLVALAGCDGSLDLGRHVWGEGSVVKEATCTDKGITIFKCLRCGASRTETVSALGHDFSNEVVDDRYLAVPPSPGTSAKYYKSCTRCGQKGTEMFYAFQDEEPSGPKQSIKCYSKPNPNVLTDYTSFYDDDYYYYLFNLGKVYNVQLGEAAIDYFDGFTERSFKETTERTTESSVKSKVSEVTTSSSHSDYSFSESLKYTRSLSLSGTLSAALDGTLNASVGVNASASVENGITANQAWGYSNSSSVSKAYENASIEAEKEGEEKSYSFTKGNPAGKYIKALFGTVDVFSCIIVDPKTNGYAVFNFSTIRDQGEWLFYLGEGVDEYDNTPDEKLKLPDYREVESIVNTPPNRRIKNYGTNYVTSKLLPCRLDNGYNYDDPGPNANDIGWRYDDDEYGFGSFVLKDVSKSDDGAFLIEEGSSLSFMLDYSSDSFPVRAAMTSRIISDDTANSLNLYRMPCEVGNCTVNKGLLVAYVEYYDGSPSDRIIRNNFFANKKAHEEIGIIEEIKKPCKVTISICFEFEMRAPGIAGISGRFWMNYRINQTFDFSLE